MQEEICQKCKNQKERPSCIHTEIDITPNETDKQNDFKTIFMTGTNIYVQLQGECRPMEDNVAVFLKS